jgi:hypothetical protein
MDHIVDFITDMAKAQAWRILQIVLKVSRVNNPARDTYLTQVSEHQNVFIRRINFK